MELGVLLWMWVKSTILKYYAVVVPVCLVNTW